MRFFGSGDWSRTRELVLAALREGPAYGLDVIERVAHATAGRVTLGGNVYHVLRTLESEGVATSYEGEGGGPCTGKPKPGERCLCVSCQRGGRPRVYYKLVDRGAN